MSQHFTRTDSNIRRRDAFRLAGIAALGVAGAVAAPGVASAAETSFDLPVITANIGRDNKSQRETAIRDVRRTLTYPSGAVASPLVGWQEIGEGDDDLLEKGWIEQYFGSAYSNLSLDGVGSLVPLSVPNTFSVTRSGVVRVHEGLAGVSPHRTIDFAVLAASSDPTLTLAFVNTHFVAGAFNGQQDSHEDWRVMMWHRMFDSLKETIGNLVDQGHTVIWTGDVNRMDMPLMFPAKEKRAFDSGIDQIGWIPATGGSKLELKGTRTITMNVDDHNARVARFQISS